VPITSNCLLSHLILHNTQLTFSKKFSDLHKTQIFLQFLRRSNLPPFWSTLRTSLPRFEVSSDIGSGTCDLGHDLSDLKTSGNFASELSTFS